MTIGLKFKQQWHRRLIGTMMVNWWCWSLRSLRWEKGVVRWCGNLRQLQTCQLFLIQCSLERVKWECRFYVYHENVQSRDVQMDESVLAEMDNLARFRKCSTIVMQMQNRPPRNSSHVWVWEGVAFKDERKLVYVHTDNMLQFLNVTWFKPLGTLLTNGEPTAVAVSWSE